MFVSTSTKSFACQCLLMELVSVIAVSGQEWPEMSNAGDIVLNCGFFCTCTRVGACFCYFQTSIMN